MRGRTQKELRHYQLGRFGHSASGVARSGIHGRDSPRVATLSSNPMTDAVVRALQRRYEQSRSQADELAWLLAGTKSGRLSRHRRQGPLPLLVVVVLLSAGCNLDPRFWL